jgi:hypothetical protein
VCIASGDSQALLNAIHAAANATSPITIGLEQGQYVIHSDISNRDLGDDFRITGGFVPTPQHVCDSAQRSVDASKTTVSFDGVGLVLENFNNGAADSVVGFEALTLDGGQQGGNDIIISSHVVEFTNVHITNNNGLILGNGYGGGIGNTISLKNVLIDNLWRISDSCSVILELTDHSVATINHFTIDLPVGDLCLSGGTEGGSKHVALWNSIVWGAGVIRTVHDPNEDPITIELNDVDFNDVAISPSDVLVTNPEYPNYQVDPLWKDPANGDYTIGDAANSVAVNSGTVATPGGEPHTDIAGADRTIGSLPDLGAYESPYNDFAGSNVFDVFNTNDTTNVNSPLYPGSLRAAMDGYFASGQKSLIQFFLPCPSVITLVAPLPLVWYPLTVNGYSSPGSVVNTDPGAFFNGTLCVAVTAANIATTPSAFIVPSGAHDSSLTVKGVGFGSFVQSINLAGGYSHQIIGNEFGGVMNGVQLGSSYAAGVQINTSGSAIVGGSSPADRNVFQNGGTPASNGAAVQVSTFANNVDMSCQIIGNLFGITPDGISAVPNNNYGILLQGNGCFVQGNRMAGNIKDAIYIEGNNHVVQNNVIGPGMFFGQDFYNPGAGIRIGADASNNTIGAPIWQAGTYYQNVIRDMDMGGVIVAGGIGNSVIGNWIVQNGLQTGLNIDLGANGTTANDLADLDAGVNDLTNYPVPYGLVWTNGSPLPGAFDIAAEIRGTLDLQPGLYRVDAYYGHECLPTGRGGGGWISGAFFDVAVGEAPKAFSLLAQIPDYDVANGRISLATTMVSPGPFSTSEFSECLSVDTIFHAGFEL